LQNSLLESSCVVVALIENYNTSKPLKVSPEKSHILSCDTVVANERYVASENCREYEKFLCPIGSFPQFVHFWGISKQ